jgi:uncharacterized membrane protein YgdD (TMEM256/DUF423 family)
MTPQAWIAAGAGAMALAVAFGAFGAHGLKHRVSPDLLAVWETAARYHAYHALGLIAVGMARGLTPAQARLTDISGWLMFSGLFLFSGSLYVLALSGQRWLGAVTPLGGAAWIASWCLLSFAMTRSPS